MAPRREALEFLIALVGGAILLVGLVVPGLLRSVLYGLQRDLSVTLGIPRVAVIGGLILLGTLAWIVLVALVIKGSYRVWGVVGRRVRWVAGHLLPESALWRFATGVTLFIVVVFVIISVLPAVVGDLDRGESLEELAEDMSGPPNATNWAQFYENDAIEGGRTCRDRPVEGSDRDGDGLPDEWERDGETPGGVPLPGADPARKDLYVQLNYGSNVEPLTGAERDQLRSVFERMPVENPDGSTGIRVHLDETSRGAGPVGDEIVLSQRSDYDRYYTEEYLGDRLCVYHQVAYGRLELNRTAGVASMPGYAAIVEGRRFDGYTGNVSFRVAITTHELLHNVAGRVEGRPHTNRGWLTGGPGEEYLSNATTRDINENGLFGPLR